MRSIVSFLLLLPLSLCAQVNDMFYVPKKEIKQKDVVKVLSVEDDEWGIADNGNNRDVDEYNRRGKVVPRNSSTVSDEALGYDTYDETLYSTDYDYSRRIVRFYNPTNIVVAAPWCWEPYPSYWYYDGFWDTHWDFYWHYGYNLSWHTPLLHHSWHHTPPPPVHGYYNGVRHNTARRIPVANMRANGENNGRVPVAGVARDKKPVAGERVERKRGVEPGKGNGNAVNREKRSNGENRRPAVQNREKRENNVQRSSPSSTYNRRSSTSVNRTSSPRTSNNRTPVSRGGVSRSGRR